MVVIDNSYCSLGVCWVFCRSSNACRICCFVTRLDNKFILAVFHASMFKWSWICWSEIQDLSVCISINSSNTVVGSQESTQDLVRMLAYRLQREGKTSLVQCRSWSPGIHKKFEFLKLIWKRNATLKGRTQYVYELDVNMLVRKCGLISYIL